MMSNSDQWAFIRQTAANDPLSVPCDPETFGRVIAWCELVTRRYELEQRLVAPAIEAARDQARIAMASGYRQELERPEAPAGEPA